MKLNCEIIKDLIPQCVDEIASDDSVNLVMEHILTCESCRNEYEKQKQHIVITNHNQEKALIKISEKLKKSKLKTMAVTCIMTIFIFLVAYMFFDIPLFGAFDKNNFIITESNGMFSAEIINDRKNIND